MKNSLLIVILMIFGTANAQNSVNSVEFDGVDGYIDYGNSAIISTFPITVQADVKLPVGYPSLQKFGIFRSDDTNGPYAGFWCQIYPNEIEIGYGDGNCENGSCRRSKHAPHSISEDTWVNIACVFNGPTDMTVYIDGVDVGGTYSGTGGTYSPTNGGNAYSALAITSSVTTYSIGKLDNLSTWSIELSQSEISQYIVCPPVGTETGIEGFWNFEEAMGTIAEDLTTNNNDGALIGGATWSTDVPTNNCNLTINELGYDTDKKLEKIVDMMGRETKLVKNTPLIYIYSDGSTKKIFITE
ncbi:MAG: hypothetical protein QNK23_12175 [Crocinitomicaceae bacterium]|nr:hypothetical protein [Crocinitomicaceae bacterium]